MYLLGFFKYAHLITLFTLITCDRQLQQSINSASILKLNKLQDDSNVSHNFSLLDTLTAAENTKVAFKNRIRRDNADNGEKSESSFQKDEIGWTKINTVVDMVIPMVLEHLQKLGIEYMELPDMKETISVSPLFLTYEAGLYLNNGIVYNIAGLERFENAFMTYHDKSFLSRFFLIIKKLQFEYNFVIKLMALEGYGKVIGSLDDTIIYAELAVNVTTTRLKLNDFRIVKFGNIRVQLDQIQIIRQLTGAILSPITNMFRDRITTSISDGLKEQMQMVMDDFNGNDPLELRKFTKQMLASLTGQTDKANNSTIN